MSAPIKILLVQLYSNGDCLYATTVARQIKKDFPGCHLTWAIASFCKNIIANNPFVDAVMEVSDVKKNDVKAFRRFRRRVYRLRDQGEFDKVFVTHNVDTNHAYYDGSIRSSILKAYPHPITVPVIPVLQLSAAEKDKAEQFAVHYRLKQYRNVILFEYAPLSGQLNITTEIAIAIAEDLVAGGNAAVILSSANKIQHGNPAIIDGSILSVRETAALTHYCTLLLGCSSGITWASTSDAAKQLPMIQLLNAETTWVNPVSRDFERFNLPVESVIEILEVDRIKIVNCAKLALRDFPGARAKFNQPVPLHFKTTRSIIYNLLCYLEFKAILKHVRVNREVYGDKLSFYKEVMLGFAAAPVTLLKNFIVKRLLKGRK